jgi:two-component system sensor histidine kinase YesM
MNQFYSLKNILLSIFLLSFLLPITVMVIIIPTSFINNFQEETDLLIHNNLELFSENLNSYLLELQQLTSYPLYREDILHHLESGQDGAELFTKIIPDYLRISRKHILSLVLHYEGKTLYSNRNGNVRLAEDYDFADQSWDRETEEGGENINYIGSHRPEYFTHSETLTVFSVARNITHPYREEALGVVIADADTAVFEEMLKNFDSRINSVTILLDEKNNILFSSEEIPPASLAGLIESKDRVPIGMEVYRASYDLLSPSKWKVVILLSHTEIQRTILFIYLKVFLLSLAGFLIALSFYNYFSRRFISNPISRMMTIMKEAETGRLEVRRIPKSIQEINSMGRSLNDMIRQLNNHINTEYKLVLQQKNAEYRALQSQIQPHFIYNVLNGFFALNRMGKRDILEKSIMDLTGMLRYNFTPEEQATVRDELDFLERYCALQKLRFEERLDYSIHCSERAGNQPLPRLLVQPLVENAVKHGVEPLLGNCLIRIAAETVPSGSREYLSLRVSDDGAGFDPDGSRENVGLQNIRERLKLLSPLCRIAIDSTPGKGTDITILIPLEKP